MRNLAYIAILLALIAISLIVINKRITITLRQNEWTRERFILECQKLAANKTREDWAYKSCVDEFQQVKGSILKI